MFRFLIDQDEWILRFSTHVEVEDDDKQAIVEAIAQLDKTLLSFSHGESFIIFHESIGIIVFYIEKVPSLILSVISIVPKDKWYIQKNKSIQPY
ncbi:hypothetical protein [Bacillus dakarensis]|uniref:hypothetical protein n=1 Tax=Robertmurraya dakarensis TaxID=1926278 RepID=UPI0009816EBE|nr:hypothetical protein [Bacillus dakarensis]